MKRIDENSHRLFFLLLIVFYCAGASANPNRQFHKTPNGTLVRFETEFLIAAETTKTHIGTLKSGEGCFLGFNPETFDRVIRSGVENQTTNTSSSAGWQCISLGKLNIWCDKSNFTIAEFTEAMSGKISMKVPPPPEPKDFEF